MMKAPVKPRRLISPGPISEEFMRSRAFIKGIIGPVGSGKTMAALQCGLRLGAMQKPVFDEKTGINWRKARFGVIRESYPSIDSTTLKSWWTIVPEDEGIFNKKAPYTHNFRKILRRENNDRNGRPIDILDIEYEFRAIGDAGVEGACRGWEVNGVFVDELDLQPEDLVPYLTGRVGRFSDLDASLVVDPQIICSLNMPDVDNHAYRLLMDQKIEGLTPDEMLELETALDGRPLVQCFVQPGGLDPKAENLHNLKGGRGYYLLQVASNKHKPGYVDRMVHNKSVLLQHGEAVNGNFSYTDHRQPLEWDRRRKVIVGIDQGLFAAAVATQRNQLGQLRSLAELVNLDDRGKALKKVSGKTFGQRLRTMVLERFPGIQKDEIRFVADPAAFIASDREKDDYDWIKAVEGELGFKIFSAKSNRLALRHEAIWQAQDERDGYLVDPSCKHLIKAHMGGYRYAKAEIAGTGETKGHLQVADTIYTHVADAEQYAALEGENVVVKLHGRTPRTSAIVNDSSYNILGD